MDRGGPLLTVEGEGEARTVLRLGFDPAPSWTSRDPAFVVLVGNIVGLLSGGPRRWAVDGLLSPGETRCSSVPLDDAAAALAETFSPDPVLAAPGRWLLLFGAVLLLGAAVPRR